jgi:hypothetical protein
MRSANQRVSRRDADRTETRDQYVRRLDRVPEHPEQRSRQEVQAGWMAKELPIGAKTWNHPPQSIVGKPTRLADVRHLVPERRRRQCGNLDEY